MKIALLTIDHRETRREYHLPEPYFHTAIQALIDGFAQVPQAEVHVISCWQQPMAASSKLAPNIWFHGLHVPKIGWLRTAYQGCIRATRAKLQEIRPDIVHGQGTERECAMSAVLSGFPNVLTIHGNMRLVAKVNQARPFSFEWLQARLESFALPRSRGVVCITRYTEEAVRRLARRTWLLPNAVDPSYFNVARAPIEPPMILCVGQVQPRKNQNAFIRALDPLAKKQQFRVLFLSGPSTDDYTREFHALLKNRPWCQFGGWAGRDELRQRLSEAAMVVLPSLEDNCPMVVLEAMAAGVPVIAANVGGVPDLVEDGRNGLMIDPLSESSMCGAVERLLTDQALTARLAAAAHSEAPARFHPRSIATRHVEIYREALAQSL